MFWLLVHPIARSVCPIVTGLKLFFLGSRRGGVLIRILTLPSNDGVQVSGGVMSIDFSVLTLVGAINCSSGIDSISSVCVV